MQYTEEKAARNKSKANKAIVEAKKIASDYSEKIQTVINQEQQDM